MSHGHEVAEPTTYAMVAEFDSAEALIAAAEKTKLAGYRNLDAYSPFPVHGLSEAIGFHDVRLPWMIFIGGISGTFFGYTLQWYTAVIDYPMNVGGKPDNSTLAFIPITFEITVLLGGLSTVAALFLRTRLYPGKKEQLFAEGITNDTFALVLRKRDNFFDSRHARRLLEENGAQEIFEEESEQ